MEFFNSLNLNQIKQQKANNNIYLGVKRNYLNRECKN